MNDGLDFESCSRMLPASHEPFFEFRFMSFPWIDLFLIWVAFVAGIVDTVAGGGGLITVPALVFSGMDIVMALGTNKLQSFIGEGSAVFRFWKMGGFTFYELKWALCFTVMGSAMGTILLQYSPERLLDRLIPWLLLAVLCYYVMAAKPDRGMEKNRLPENPSLLSFAGAGIGFYNGFFGPGTGSIWIIALTQLYRLRINAAVMYTKPLNMMGNLTALSIFFSGGKIDYLRALTMGIGSLIGGQVGATLVLYKSAHWLRILFLTIMGLTVFYSFIKFYHFI